MAGRTGTIADAVILAKHGADELPEKGGITFRGWTFRTSHNRIVGEQGLIDIAAYVSKYCNVSEREDDTITIGQSNLHLPPMIFGHDILDVTHGASNNKLYFSAKDALACWAHQHTEEGCMARIAKVPYAHEWSERHKGGLQQGATIPVAGVPPEGLTAGGIPLVEVVWDWTYTTDYCCSLSKDYTEVTEASSYSSPEAILSAKSLSAAEVESSDGTLQFRKISASGIDTDMLRQRQDILFYDEITLYEDDLEDCGEVSMSLKIRVMPSCWFILSRVFTRVDGSVVTIRDARFFHSFDSNKVYLDLLWQQQNMTPSPVATDDSASVRSVHGDKSRFPMGAGSPSAMGAGGRKGVGAVAPSVPAPPPNQVRDPNAWSRILPDVTESEKVHKNFELTIFE